MNWNLLRLFFHLGAVLNVIGVISLFVGASLLSRPISCFNGGCPSTAIYWEEAYIGFALILLGSGMMIFSTLVIRGQPNRPLADASKKWTLTSFKAALVALAILGLSMFLLGFVFAFNPQGVTFQCSSTLPCWPPGGPGEPEIMLLLGVFLAGLSYPIWKLLSRISYIGPASGQQ